VKEVFATATGPMTTGTVSHVETLEGWFVMVKDFKKDCLSCRVPSTLNPGVRDTMQIAQISCGVHELLRRV
jgi:hypothetical protein